jgi:beta-glucanase (GH16 family)
MLILLAVLGGCLIAASLTFGNGGLRRGVHDVVGSAAVAAGHGDSAPTAGPIARRGYRRVFVDNFTIFNRRRWSRSIWYDEPAAAGDIFVRKGVLHLVSRRTRGYPMVSVTTLRRRHFRRGYFEARMRWTKGNGSWPAFWLFSVARASGDVPSPEIDMFEGQGSEARVFYGTVHRNSSGCCGMPDRQNDNNWQPQRVDLTAGFHIYAALWDRSSVTWYLDGRKLMRAPVYDTTDHEMFLVFDMWAGGWTKEADDSTPDELHTEVDWVRVWQK